MKYLLFLVSLCAWGQTYNLGVKYTNADPVGVCMNNSTLVSNYNNGKLWRCFMGTWTEVTGGGGGGTVSSVALSSNLGTVTGSPVTTSGTLTLTGAASDITALFSGCSGTQYLGADGACHAGGTGTVTSIATSNGITGGPITTTGTISGVDAAADGSTKGVAAFTASDFDATTGVISLDYTNGQKASGSQPGFLSSTDWTTFNNKGLGTVTSIATTSPIGGGTITTTGTITCTTCTTNASALTANLPVIGAGSNAVAVGTVSGNTTTFGTTTGTLTSGNCASFDANGNLVDSGFVCNGGTGTAAADGPCLKIGSTDYISQFMAVANPLSNTSWTWANQGTATVTTWGCGVKIQDGTYPGSNQARVRYAAKPGTNFTVIGAVTVALGLAGANSGAAICMYETATGKTLAYTISPDFGTGLIRSSGTAAALSTEVGCCGTVHLTGQFDTMTHFVWMKMVYNGTTISTYVNSADPTDTNQWRLVEAALTATTYFTTAPDSGCIMISDKVNPINITGIFGSFQMTTP